MLSDKDRTRRTVCVGLLSTFALMLSYIESILPLDFGIRGFRIGLANIAVVTALYTVGAGSAFAVNGIRIVLAALLFGTPISFLYSVSGGVVSLAVMIFMKKVCGCKTVGCSVAGGVFHNLAQLCVACLFTKTVKIIYLLPLMLVFGIVTGLVVALTSGLLISRLGDMLKR